MRLLCAPMEGVTGAQFRRVHRACFGGVDRYVSPFLSPTQDRVWTRRERRELLPQGVREPDMVPQLLTKDEEVFLWAAGELAAMGFEEVNLNLGCPSGTVTAKGKGAGMLADPETLDRFLEQIFSKAPLAISVKTRLGMREPEEFDALLQIFCRYPIKELILHPRVREDFYKKPVRREAFAAALAQCTLPLCYNGDLFDQAAIAVLQVEFPAVQSVMLGRGLAGNPALARQAAGGAPLTLGELEAFLGRLFEAYSADFQNPHAAMLRMKELWGYLIGLFDGAERPMKALRKARTPAEYQACAAAILRDGDFRPDNRGGF